MGFLDDLIGGGKRQQDYSDFVRRYDQGHPALDALARLSPEERAGFARMLQQRAEAKGVPLSGDVTSNPRDPSQILTNIHETPGRLRDLFGAGGGEAGQRQTGGGMADMLSSPLAKAALAGIAAMVVKRAMNR